ncbi:MAG: hypothetical protein NTY02_13305 [Acidobacteria bacterium]|nr:hypothetical protein [Acidobacteriota bacterium]
MIHDTASEGSQFVIPAQTLRGSRETMVADIDQAIVGLLALRHLISGGAQPPRRVTRPDTPERAVLARLSASVRAVGRTLSISSATRHW